MKKYIVIGFVLIGFPYIAFASSVVINEVMFNPTGDDTGNEWVELYNGSNEQVDISGWELYPDGIGYVTIPNGFLIGAKRIVLIHLRLAGNNSGTDIYQTTGSSNMGNTSGSVALFSGEPRKDTIKSFVQWGRGGETWESAAVDAGLWDKGSFIDLNSFLEGNSLVLKEDGIAADGKNAWSTSNTPTQGAHNTQGSVSISPSPSASSLSNAQSSSSSSPSPAHAVPIKSITAYAGEDISSMVGMRLEFLGHARGINDDSIDSSARFFWNFGDGETQEGRSVAHIYRMPGIYAANVQVSSGEYAASDYIRVQVSPNLVGISSVVLGIDGYLRLTNASDNEADISDWKIRDNKGQTFMIPPHTKMARRGDAVLSNSVTGLLKESASLPLTVLYPNGVVAFTVSSAWDTAELQNVSKQTQAPDTSAAGEARQGRQDAKISEEKKSQSIAVVTRTSTPSPAPTLEREDKKEYATTAHAPFISFPFMMAIGVGILGAAGFLIAKKFS